MNDILRNGKGDCVGVIDTKRKREIKRKTVCEKERESETLCVSQREAEGGRKRERERKNVSDSV